MEGKLKRSLLLLRLGVFIVMFVWTLDKFVNPGHTIKVFSHFYKIPFLTNNLAFIAGSLQLVVIFGFLLGVKKKITYGLVLIMHGVSTFSSYTLYLNPWSNLLFFAAWPMLAAAYALYSLRDYDTLLSFGR